MEFDQPVILLRFTAPHPLVSDLDSNRTTPETNNWMDHEVRRRCVRLKEAHNALLVHRYTEICSSSSSMEVRYIHPHSTMSVRITGECERDTLCMSAGCGIIFLPVNSPIFPGRLSYFRCQNLGLKLLLLVL